MMRERVAPGGTISDPPAPGGRRGEDRPTGRVVFDRERSGSRGALRRGDAFMSRFHRREFLAEVGKGMLVAGVGSALAQDLGLAPPTLAADANGRLTFGPMEPLVALMQET